MLDNVSFPSRRSRRDVHHRRQFGQPGEPIFPGGGDGPKGGNPQAAPAADTSTTPAPVQPPTSTPQTSTTPSSTSTASSTTPSSTSASPTQPSVSSTTASSASSTTGTSTPSSAPASTPPVPLSTSTPLAVVPSKPVANPTVNVVYETSTLGNAASAASASSSSTPAPQGGVSTGIIVGGVAAGAVAIIGILFGIVYFVRKRKSDEDDVLGSWNPDDVRRQSEMIHDSDPIMPSSGMGGMGMGGGGYGSAGARPPTMIERHVNNASPMLARQRSMGAQYAPQQPTMPAFDHNGYPIESGYGAGGYGGQQQRYADYPQDDFMRNMPPAGNPFMSPYEQPMASPVSSTVPIYDSRIVAEPSAAVTRQPSVTQQQGGPVRKPSLLSSPQEADAYADLDRSSVTPFQAQQYAEIQSKLHGGPQAGALGSVEEEQHHQQYHQQQQQQGGPTPPPAAVTPGRVSPTHSAPNQPIARTAPTGQGQGQDAAKRPDTMYSAIYDEEDVYGGI